MPLDVKLMNLTTGILVMGFALLVSIGLAKWIARLPVFDITGITVVGDVSHNSVVNLRANVTPRLGGTFFTIDLGRVRSTFENVPWVRKAVVQREFPNRLLVKLQEHKAVAYWGGEGELQLINSFGEVFEANVGEVDQDTLPRLNGPQGQSMDVLAMYRALVPQFAAMDMTLDEVVLTERGSWTAQLDTGADIALGRGSVEEVQVRVQRFLKTLTQVTGRYGRRANSLESADLRHENGYALKLRGVTTLATDGGKKQ